MRRGVNIVIAIVSVAASLLLVEAVLRAVGYEYTPLRIEILDKTDWRLHHAFDQKDFVYDPVLLWRPRGGLTFNAQGFRGPDVPSTKRAGELRILALGDSNTLGWGKRRDVSWPHFLGQTLAQVDARFTVINAGAWGYTSFQGVRRFDEALAFEPDLVLVSFGGNDAQRVVVPDATFAGSGIRRLRLDRFLHRTRVGQLVIAMADRLGSSHRDQLVPRVDLDEYRANLRRIVQTGKGRHVTVVLLTRPFIGESPFPNWWKNFAPAYNATTLEVGTQEGVPVIDVYEFFRERPELFIDESHFTEEGHHVMAGLVYEQIKPLLGVPAGSGPPVGRLRLSSDEPAC